LLLAVTCGVWPALAPAQTHGPVTLRQAVDEALSHGDRAIDDRDAAARAELGLEFARDAFRPKLVPNVLGSFGQTDLSSQTYRVDIAQRFVTGTEVRLGVGTATAQIPGADGDLRFYNADTTVSVSQPLLRGAGRAVGRRALTAAELQRDDAVRQRALGEQQLVIEVASAYYQQVAAHTLVEVARQSVQRARRLRDSSEAKLDAGLVSQLDVLRAQQLVAQTEMQLFDAQAAVGDARDQLRRLTGRGSDAWLEVDRVVPAPPTAPIDGAQATALALRHRLDLQTRRAAHADGDRQLGHARNQLLPQVDVNLALTRRRTTSGFVDSFALDGFTAATFFTIGMPDRSAQRAAYQNALLDRNRREREVARLERQVTDEVRRALRDRDRQARNVIAADTAVELSRREVEVAQLRFERGLSSTLDVVSAEAGLLQAESRRVQALAEATLGRLRLRAVLGILDPRDDLGLDAAAAVSAVPQ